METKVIGGRIAEARKKINISQAQLAKQLFISPQAVGKWERGESIPDMVTCTRLAEILGVDLNYFSENFKSAGAAPLPQPSTEPPSGKLKNKPAWDMSRGNWVDADFSGLKNLKEKFSSSNMKNCRFVASDLSGLLLRSNHVDSCDFSGSDISNSQVQHSHMLNNLFKECSLKETSFSGSYITGCDFTNADFTGAVAKSGGFEKNIITNAVWNGTSFNDQYLGDMIFDGTIEDCYFENCSFKKLTFQNATLINTFFKNKNLKGIRFVDCQADRMTYEFLKSGKADLNGITLLTPKNDENHDEK